MSAQNDFLAFCNTDTGTNLLDEADYLAATDRISGNKPGVASAKLNNKALRQSSAIISQFAQYICNKIGVDMLDDGTLSTTLTNIVSAFADPIDSYNIQNLGLSVSVATNALTIALKQADGSTDGAATAPIKIGFRNATLTSGAFSTISVTGALSIVVPSGATLGQSSGVNQYVWVYLLNNAGTAELAVSGVQLFDDYTIQSSTTIGGGSTSGTTLYSTTGRSNVAIRLIGRLLVNEAAAGTWATAVNTVSLVNGKQPVTVTPWVSTTFTGAWNTNVSYTGYSRRVGDTLHCQGIIALSGAPNAANLQINIPNSGVIDTSKLATTVAGQVVTLGTCISIKNATSDNQGSITYSTTTAVNCAVFTVSGTHLVTSQVSATSPVTFGNTDGVSFIFSVPIVGWSVNGP